MEVLSPDEGRLAVQLARQALTGVIQGRSIHPPDDLPLPPVFKEERGVFVTIRRHGLLRGCIGLPYPVYPLKEALIEAAVSAGTADPRFLPVTEDELDDLELEVTILSVPEVLDCPPAERLDQILVGRDGIIIQGMGRSGLLLPQVPLEYAWDSREFLDQTCAKAGLPAGCWKRADVEVCRFEGQIFSHPAGSGAGEE